MIDRLVMPLLVAGCVAFGAILLLEIKQPARIAVAAGAPAQPADPLSAPRPLPAAPAPPIATILARPLFSPSRRPPHSDLGNDADAGGLSDSRLAGIVVEPGRRFAIFAPTGAKPLVVTEGETVSGWRVESISPTEVALSGPDGTKTLQPKFDPNFSPPPEPAPAPAPAPVFNAPPNVRPGVIGPRPGMPPFVPGQARLRQLRRR
jgi:hypothetical protein